MYFRSIFCRIKLCGIVKSRYRYVMYNSESIGGKRFSPSWNKDVKSNRSEWRLLSKYRRFVILRKRWSYSDNLADLYRNAPSVVILEWKKLIISDRVISASCCQSREGLGQCPVPKCFLLYEQTFENKIVMTKTNNSWSSPRIMLPIKLPKYRPIAGRFFVSIQIVWAWMAVKDNSPNAIWAGFTQNNFIKLVLPSNATRQTHTDFICMQSLPQPFFGTINKMHTFSTQRRSLEGIQQ